MTTIPLFDSTLLPTALQAPATKALAAEDYGILASLLTVYLESGEPRDAAMLLCLAVCRVEDARRGPFEHLMSRCADALFLLDEARQQKAPAATVRAVRSRTKRIQATEQELQALEAAEPQTLDAATLTRVKHRAYALADRKGVADYLTSARLWQILYRHARAMPDAHTADNQFYYFVRAGLEFAQGTRFDLARPYLEAIVDTEQPIDESTEWMVEYAYRELLHHATAENDRAAFETLW